MMLHGISHRNPHLIVIRIITYDIQHDRQCGQKRHLLGYVSCLNAMRPGISCDAFGHLSQTIRKKVVAAVVFIGFADAYHTHRALPWTKIRKSNYRSK